MFAELLKVKRYRADRALRATQVAAAAVERAKAAVRDAESALEQHRVFMAAEETRLFDEIRGKPVSMKQIDKLKFDTAALKAKELELAEALETAKQAVSRAEEALAEAKTAQRAADRTVAKFEEFVSIEEMKARAEATSREDAELEEVSEAAYGARAAAARQR